MKETVREMQVVEKKRKSRKKIKKIEAFLLVDPEEPVVCACERGKTKKTKKLKRKYFYKNIFIFIIN